MERAKPRMRWRFSSSIGVGAETFEAGDEGAREAGQPVAVREDGFAFDCVEGLADFSGRILVMIEVADECGDGAFEVDVVFPEGVVGVDEERLAGRKLGHEDYRTESDEELFRWRWEECSRTGRSACR